MVNKWQSNFYTQQITINFSHLIPKDFDYRYYIDTYPDLLEAGIDDEQKAKEHYLIFGIKENRIFNNQNIKEISNANLDIEDIDETLNVEDELKNFNRIMFIKNKKTHLLNRFFDAIFVINVESDTRRKNNILKLDDNEITYFYVNAISYKDNFVKNFCNKIISKTNSEIIKNYDFTYTPISLCATNILILNYCISNNIKSFLILEDDFLFHKNFESLFRKSISNLPNDWNIIWLGSKQGEQKPEKYNNNWFLPNHYTWATHAYAMKNCAELVKKEFEKFDSPIDVTISKRLKNLNKYVSKEQLIISVCEGKVIGPEKVTETYKLWNWEIKNYITKTKKSINLFESKIHSGAWLNGINGVGAWGTFRKILSSISDKDGEDVFFDFIDRDFGWNFDINKIKYLNNFYGILHHPYSLPDYLYGSSKKLIENISNNNLLSEFNTIFTLSFYLNKELKKDKNIKKNKVNIKTIFHPSNMFDGIVNFDISDFRKNKQKHLIALGGAFRKLNSIDKLKLKINKVWMFGDSPTYLKNLQMECQNENYHLSNKTQLHKEVNFKEYNQILSKNIVFLDFIESSANNAIIECIARSTPMIIKRHPAVIEYLGENYPLYFDELNECKKLMTLENLKEANQYLKNMNKSKFSFFNSFRTLYNMLD